VNIRKLCSKSLQLGVAVVMCVVALHAVDRGHPHPTCCPGSPENPSIVLALLGSAAVTWQYLKRVRP
jgi:hypothetical protein